MLDHQYVETGWQKQHGSTAPQHGWTIANWWSPSYHWLGQHGECQSHSKTGECWQKDASAKLAVPLQSYSHCLWIQLRDGILYTTWKNRPDQCIVEWFNICCNCRWFKQYKDILRKLDITPYHAWWSRYQPTFMRLREQSQLYLLCCSRRFRPLHCWKDCEEKIQHTREQYLIKWQGYCSAENTWELPSNIPSSILQAFESSLVQSKTGALGQTRREGLWQNWKTASKEGFILNIYSYMVFLWSENRYFFYVTKQLIIHPTLWASLQTTIIDNVCAKVRR